MQRYITLMSTGTGSAKYRCAQCEQSESSCECEKFCCLCQSVMDIRICDDGLMYCEPCRKACDYKTVGLDLMRFPSEPAASKPPYRFSKRSCGLTWSRHVLASDSQS